jgi:ABC-type enterochelin transport system substrate-binding protein
MKKILLVMVALMMMVLGACSNDKEGSTEKASQESTPVTETENQDAKESTGEVSQADAASKLALETTKLVEVFSINQRLHDDYKELGPCWVVRGIDSKGRSSEVWVLDGKIYDIQ